MAQHGVGLTNSAEELAAAFAEGNTVVVDVRGADENSAGPSVPGATLCTWDRDGKTMPTGSLPADKSTPLLVH